MVNKRFGRLLVIKRVSKPVGVKSKEVWYLCECVCGNEKVVRQFSLKTGHTKSCGCLKYEKDKEGKHSHSSGGKVTAEYRAWGSIIQRCENQNDGRYYRYGGRGIKVCARWRIDFLSFYEDMGPRPSKDHSVDRVNNDGNYEPSNCRWATRKQQSRNTRLNKMVEYNGCVLIQKDWADMLGLSSSTISRYVKAGCTIGDIATHFKVEEKLV